MTRRERRSPPATATWHPGAPWGPVILPPVTLEGVARYAEASGDRNPIHLDADAAREAGLPGVIQHGMLTMGQLGAIFTPWLGDGFVERFELRFRVMVRIGDELRAGGIVSAVEDGADGVRTSFEVRMENQGGTVVADGEVVLLQPAGERGRPGCR